MLLGTAVWTDGRRTVAVWGGGALSVWDGRKLVNQVDRVKGGRSGSPPPETRAAWNEATGWPANAVDHVGDWTLTADHPRLVAVDGRQPARNVVRVRWGKGRHTRLFDPQRPSGRARLQRGIWGTVLVDPDQGLVWCLDDGVAIHLSGVGDQHYLGAARVPGGFVVHEALSQRGGWLARIDDDGRVHPQLDVYGHAHDLFADPDGVWGVIPEETDGGVGPSLARIDPATGAVTRIEPVDYATHGHWKAGHRWVVLDGSRVRIFGFVGVKWVEEEPLERPTGEPTSLHGPPRVGEVTLEWTGSAGGFRAVGDLCNTGQDHVGLRAEVQADATVQVTAVTLGSTRLNLREGDELAFSSVPLPHGVAVPVAVEGQAAGPGVVRIAFAAVVARPVDPERPRHEVDRLELGEVRVVLRLRGGELELRRADRILALDPEWLATAAGAIDAAVPEPDLGRWVRRALARARVAAFDEAPEAVRTEWLRLSEPDRTAGSASGVAAHKLRTGLGWRVTAEEASRLAKALGPDHPLGAFASGGAFDVVGPALDELLRRG